MTTLSTTILPSDSLASAQHLLLLCGLLALLGVLLASMIEADASKVSELSAVLTFVVLRPTAIPCAVLASAASTYVVAGMARCCVSLWLV